MSWQRLVLSCSQQAVENLSNILSELGALSVTVEPLDGDDADDPVFGEPGNPDFSLWTNCQIEILLPFEMDTDIFIKSVYALSQEVFEIHSRGILDDQDWIRLTQNQFEPIAITPDLWIVPSWHTPPNPQAINLRLDPGQAFGTGSHPTTRLCLRWLSHQALQHQHILDYGCGSGILTLAAALLGAPHPTGVDLDPVAVLTARENALRNGVNLTFYEPDQLPEVQLFDGIIANILTNPLIMLAPLLIQKLRPGGWLTLSGILESQVSRIQSAYSPQCSLVVVDHDEGWVCLHGVKQVY
ncbi:MAG: 50S ribosomal protein L11 methyltransferase [Betaproteobacteria bacterium]|jgi:ribosomal protein L11 methyltransferase|nr:50S ribosomal protein L11 methyltransferase [Betaproteobacteria bacterium]